MARREAELTPGSSSGEITMLLRAAAGKSLDERRRYLDQIVPLVYEDLRARARMQIGKGQRQWDTLRPTALVHEAWERLIPCGIEFESRQHFLNVASKAMRHLLVDRARKRQAAKRGSGLVISSLEETSAAQILATDPALLLAAGRINFFLTPAQVQLVELRFYAGLSYEEIAAAMNTQPDTWRGLAGKS